MKSITDWLQGSWNVHGALSFLWLIPVTVFLVFAATKIVKYAEALISKTKLGGGFIGGALIGPITSIPELVTGIEQSAQGHPGAGVADGIGANAFGAFLIGVAGIVFTRELFLKRLGKWTMISLWISFGLALASTLFMFFQDDIVIGAAGHFAIGGFSLFLFLFYLLSIWLQYRFGDEDGHSIDGTGTENISLKTSIIRFVVWSFILVGTSIILNWLITSIQEGLKFGEQSAGGIFLSMTTSLPEVVAFVTFLRAGQTSAAVAALIGSHIFNMSVSFFGDLAYGSEAMYTTEAVHENWKLGVVCTVIMFILGAFSIISRKFKIFEKRWVYAIGPSLAAATYVIGWTLILVL